MDPRAKINLYLALASFGSLLICLVAIRGIDWLVNETGRWLHLLARLIWGAP